VFSDTAQVQRCVLHKRRNVESYLPAPAIDKRLWIIFAQSGGRQGQGQRNSRPTIQMRPRHRVDDLDRQAHYATSDQVEGHLYEKRCVAASMLEAERSLRGHRDMTKLLDALRRAVTPAVEQPKSTLRQQPELAVATLELQQ
jgi:hypothetical protein